MGVAIAHEVGHFLGLKHTDASQNFMNASTSGSSTNITSDQSKTMRKHGFVRRHVP
jgi:predicted Zn-dependent protease